jgi:RNA polymerase sigma-70 factor (ECF subfamily)
MAQNVESGHAVERTPLDAFVTDHYDRLVKLAWLVCRHGPDASDAVQIALERAWRKRGELRDRDSLRTWVDRIVVREAIRLSRRRNSILGRLLAPGDQTDHALEPTDPRADSVPAWTDFRVAFAHLSAEQRAVVALHLYAGYSVFETAELVDAPVETVRSRLRLARDRLRHELEAER